MMRETEKMRKRVRRRERGEKARTQSYNLSRGRQFLVCGELQTSNLKFHQPRSLQKRVVPSDNINIKNILLKIN